MAKAHHIPGAPKDEAYRETNFLYDFEIPALGHMRNERFKVYRQQRAQLLRDEFENNDFYNEDLRIRDEIMNRMDSVNHSRMTEEFAISRVLIGIREEPKSD